MVVRAPYVEPDRETDERVAEHPERDRLPEAEARLRVADREDGWPTAPPPNVVLLGDVEDNAVAKAPTKFPIQTIPQFPRRRVVWTRRLAQAMTMRLFPVKSSAPADHHEDEPEREYGPASSRRTP